MSKSTMTDILAAALTCVIHTKDVRFSLMQSNPLLLKQADDVLMLYIRTVVDSAKEAQLVMDIIHGRETIDLLAKALDNAKKDD